MTIESLKSQIGQEGYKVHKEGAMGHNRVQEAQVGTQSNVSGNQRATRRCKGSTMGARGHKPKPIRLHKGVQRCTRRQNHLVLLGSTKSLGDNWEFKVHFLVVKG